MRKVATAALALLLMASPLWAAPPRETIGLREVVQALESPFRSDAEMARGTAGSAIVDFEADFFQEARIASLDRTQRGSGRVWVKFDRVRSDRVPRTMFRWEYSQPTRQEFVSDGRTLWVYLPENNQVIQSDVEFSTEARANDPMTFLTGLGNLSRDFLITWASPNQDVQGNYVLDLRPRRGSPMIQRLLIVVDREAVLELSRRATTGDLFPILSSTVYDPSGNSTTIEFSNVRVNRGMTGSFFQFMIPAGVEVVRPTGKEMGF